MSDAYIDHLSRDVSAACIRFFIKRGMPMGFQFSNSVFFNQQNKNT